MKKNFLHKALAFLAIAVLITNISSTPALAFPGSGDTDGDGVVDTLDLDTDNDGVLDTDEGFTPPVEETNLTPIIYDDSLNASGAGTVSGRLANIQTCIANPPFSVDFDFVSTGGDIPNLRVDGPNNLNVLYSGGLSGTSNITYTFSETVNVRLGLRSNNANEAVTFITPYDRIIPGVDSTIVSNNPVVWHNRNRGSAGQDSFFEFDNVNSITLGLMGSNLSQRQSLFVSNFLTGGDCLDTDGDTIPDYLDLDSDNDGISDIVENEGSDLDVDGNGTLDITDGFVDDGVLANSAATNGIDDRIENRTGAENTGLTPLDSFNTAGDNAPNYLDLDSDDDGIPDATEARLSSAYVAYPATIDDAADSDDDGILDIYDADGVSPAAAGTFGSRLNSFITDIAELSIVSTTGVADYLNTDSDDDGILDIDESGVITGVSSQDPDGNVNDPFSGVLLNQDNDDLGTNIDVDFRSVDSVASIDHDVLTDIPDLTNKDYTVSGTCQVPGLTVEIVIIDSMGTSSSVTTDCLAPGNFSADVPVGAFVQGQLTVTSSIDAGMPSPVADTETINLESEKDNSVVQPRSRSGSRKRSRSFTSFKKANTSQSTDNIKEEESAAEVIIQLDEELGSCPIFTQYLETGDRDGQVARVKQPAGISLVVNEVAKLQTALIGLGYNPGPVDGIYGSQTASAVGQWQEEHRVQVLDPWNLSRPTQFFYQSSRRWMNTLLGCDDVVTLDTGAFLSETQKSYSFSQEQVPSIWQTALVGWKKFLGL